MKTNNREKILQVATELFLQNGYDATSISDICRSAKTNAPTIYYYFKDKRNLFFSCHIKSIEELLKPFLGKAEAIEDPYERLVFMIENYTRIVCTNPELRILIHETLSMRDEYFAAVRAEWRNHYDLLKSSISQLQSNGTARTDIKPSWATLLLLGMTSWITFWFDYKRQDEVNGLAEAVKECALHGLLNKTKTIKKTRQSSKLSKKHSKIH